MFLRVKGYQLGLGGQRVACLQDAPWDPADELHRSRLWGTGGNLDVEGGEAGLQRALALPDNAFVLRRIAGLPDDAKIVSVMRELGGGGGCDVSALLADAAGRTRLLLVDCKGAEHRGLRDQQSQALRIALATVPNIVAPSPPRVRIVLLTGWSPSLRLPPLPQPFPGAGGGLQPGHGQLPEIVWWGFLTAAIANQEGGYDDHVMLDSWEGLAAGGVAKQLFASRKKTLRSPFFLIQAAEDLCTPAGKRWATVQMRARADFLRISVRVMAETYVAALKGPTRAGAPMWAHCARQIGYQEPFPGWSFVGETNDGGCIRLNWELDGWRSLQRRADAEAVAEQERASFRRRFLDRVSSLLQQPTTSERARGEPDNEG